MLSIQRLLFILVSFLTSLNLGAIPLEEWSQTVQPGEKNLVVFLGVDWCPWSRLCVEELLTKEPFYEEVSKRLHCVQLDLQSHPDLASSFQVEAVPTLIVLSEKGEEIARFSYEPKEAKAFAKEILDSIVKEEALRRTLQSASLEVLEKSYHEAKAHHLEVLSHTILERGLALGGSSYFDKIQYAKLLKELPKSAKKFRHEMKGSVLEIALLEFQVKADQGLPKEVVTRSLKKALKKGAKNDPDVWRAHLILSQYLLAQGDCKGALSHAKKGQAKASPEEQESIARWIHTIEESLKQSL